MFQCGSCARHIRDEESRCPFCGVALATTAAPSPVLAGVVLSAGLSLLACTTGGEDEGAGVTTDMSTVAGTESETSAGTTLTTGDGDGDVTTDMTERGAEAYGSPELPCEEYGATPVMVGDNPITVDANPNWIYQSCGGGGTPSLYAFTAPDVGDYAFAVIDADFAPVVSVIGYFCEPPDELACAVAPEAATVAVAAGATVYVAIDDVEGGVDGAATLTITAVTP